MDGHELGAVRKGRFDLDLGNHFGDAVHHVGTTQHLAAISHQLGHRAAVAGAFQDGALMKATASG